MNKKGIWVPRMWAENLPAPSGTRPAEDLLDNLLHVRGVNSRNGGHPGALLNKMNPDRAEISLTAYSGDVFSRPFPSVSSGYTPYYSSSLGLLPLSIKNSGSNVIITRKQDKTVKARCIYNKKPM